MLVRATILGSRCATKGGPFLPLQFILPPTYQECLAELEEGRVDVRVVARCLQLDSLWPLSRPRQTLGKIIRDKYGLCTFWAKCGKHWRQVKQPYCINKMALTKSRWSRLKVEICRGYMDAEVLWAAGVQLEDVDVEFEILRTAEQWVSCWKVWASSLSTVSSWCPDGRWYEVQGSVSSGCPAGGGAVHIVKFEALWAAGVQL